MVVTQLNKIYLWFFQRRYGFIWLVLLAFVVLFIYQRLALSNLILARGDTYYYFYPYWDARNEALRTGNLPLWTSDLFMGAPLLANPQLGTFYPPNWLTSGVSAPEGVRWSILAHSLWAMLGAGILFRRVTGERHWLSAPVFVCASLYGVGGYALGRVENIAQWQGLAWMPWAFYALWAWLESPQARRRWLWALGLAALLAWQIFSGHTQTLFLTGAGLGLAALLRGVLSPRLWQDKRHEVLMGVFGIALAGAMALVLALPQWLPTLELSGMSTRGGGLNVQQVTAFSLPPQYLPYVFFPLYDGFLFSEYSAYLGVLGTGLALYGALMRRDSVGYVWAGIAVLALSFALGRFNPLYLLLAELPLFDLFRVPARWLALVALSGALLAGMGVQAIRESSFDRGRAWGVLLSLALLMFLGRFVLRPESADVIGSAVPNLLAWGVAWCGMLGLLLMAQHYVAGRGQVAALMVLIELYLASQVMPINDLAPPEVYSGQRYSISYLQAQQAEQVTPARLLSISPLLFDVGDKPALEARYASLGMDELSVRHALVANKRQEMIFPNLSLTWHLPSIDGFDGGILPSMYYSQLTSLILPEGTLRVTDGRLGEWLARPECRGACVPPARYLDLMGVGTLLIDKVYDVWHEDIAYDTGLWQTDANEWIAPSSYEASDVYLLLNQDSAPQSLSVYAEEGQASQNLALSEVQVLEQGLWLARYRLSRPVVISGVQFVPLAQGQVLAISLADGRDDSFLQLVPRGWQRLVSSDIKVYARTPAPARAWLVGRAQAFPDSWQGSEDALKRLADPQFDPQREVLVHSEQLPALGEALAQTELQVLSASATHWHGRVSSSAPAWLVLSEAYYPHWQARVNGVPTPVYRANVMFRAVPVPAGESEVDMRFEPQMWQGALVVGGLAWGLWALLVLRLVWRR